MNYNDVISVGYDNFVMWLWNFAQGKKVNRLVPKQLRLVCIELLQLCSQVPKFHQHLVVQWGK